MECISARGILDYMSVLMSVTGVKDEQLEWVLDIQGGAESDLAYCTD